MTRSRAATMLAAMGAIGAVCLAQSGVPRRARQGDLPVEIRLNLDQQRFIAKESMVLHVHIRNTGQMPIDVPNPENNANTQPVYTLTGPSYPQGHSFHFRGAALGDPNPPREAEPGATVRLAPGQEHDAALPLEQLTAFPKAGAYTITASLTIHGRSAASPPVEFEIEPAVIRSMAILADDGVQSSSPVRVLCLIGTPPHQRLYQAIFREERPDLGEVSLAKLVYVAPAPPEAAAVFGPWTNHDRLDSLLNRFAWQAGSLVGIEGLAGTPGATFRFPEQSRLVRPALMPDSGEVDVLALVDGSRTVEMVRFPSPRDGSGVRAAWRTQLGAAAAGSRAALAPRTAGTRRAAVFILPEKTDSQILLAEAGPGDVQPVLRSVRIDGAAPLPDSEPGIAFAADGTVYASAILSERGQPRNAFVADIRWPPGSGDGAVTRENIKRLPGAPRSAAATFSVTRGARRREWIVLLQDGAVVFSGSPGRPRTTTGTPSLPLKLLAMSKMTYLLTLDKQGLPRFELMH